jgi:hypothetical protein
MVGSAFMSNLMTRLLLNVDPTIDPVRRHNQKFDAPRDGMFLAFLALSCNLEPTIWAKTRYEGRDLLEIRDCDTSKSHGLIRWQSLIPAEARLRNRKRRNQSVSSDISDLGGLNAMRRCQVSISNCG